jgi:serine phosphatase RsbU (regulator of sigma subunit)
MLRVALRLESSLDDAFMHINDQLCDDLPDDRFVTGFFGLLDGETHTIRFHSGGQGPIMHYQAEMGEYEWHPATTFPLGYMRHSNLDPPEKSLLDPGDIFGLISDGIYEYENEAGVQFGRQGVMKVLDENLGASAQELVDRIMAAAREHGGTAPQADDITIVLVRRLPAEAGRDAT